MQPTMDNSIAKEVQKVSVETELKKSYLDYAMSVIVGRALTRCTRWLKASAQACIIRHA